MSRSARVDPTAGAPAERCGGYPGVVDRGLVNQGAHDGERSAEAGAGRHLVVAGFSLWTLFVWGGRLRNLWLEPGGFGSAGRWSLYGALAFTTLGLAVLAVWSTGRFGPGSSRFGSTSAQRLAVLALAALTAVVWLIRGVDIALGDHEAAFIAVHVVLALVSVSFAAAATKRVMASDGDPGSVPTSEPGRSSVG